MINEKKKLIQRTHAKKEKKTKKQKQKKNEHIHTISPNYSSNLIDYSNYDTDN